MKKLSIAAAVVMAAIAAPSNAVTVTSIKVTNAFPDYLQVAELQAFSGATNLAPTGTATGSSTYAAYSTPDKAIDGNTGGGYYTDTIFHSAGSGSGEYLLVSFAGAIDLTKLTLFGRTDCCGERDLFNYELFNGATSIATGQIDSRYTGSNGPGSAFFAAAAVPEPAAWGLMLGGFGLLGAASRRRRSMAVTA